MPDGKAYRVGILLTAFAVAAAVSASCITPSKAAQETIEIIRDTYGIPHVYAESRAGAYYGAGWTDAEDNAYYIYRQIAIATGRAAEYFPPVDEEDTRRNIHSDTIVQAFNIYALSSEWRKALSQEVQEVISSYTRGFNDCLSRKTPVSIFERIRPSKRKTFLLELYGAIGDISETDVVAMLLSINISEALLNLSEKESNIENGTTGSGGSNAAAVAGGLTSYYAPMLYGDLHNPWKDSQRILDLNAPGLRIHGKFMGPILISGGSDKIATAMTRNKPDGLDFYREKINPDNRRQYRYDRKWLDMTEKEITVKVRNSETVKKKLLFTKHGFLLKEPGESNLEAYSVKAAVFDTGDDPYAPLQFVSQRVRQAWAGNTHIFYQVNRRPYSAFRSIVAADIMNNIAYMYLGVIPIRPGDYNPKMKFDTSSPIDGSTSLTEWPGGVWMLGDPQFQLPSLFNPRGGVITSANNAPWYADSCGDADFSRPPWIPPHVVPIDMDDTSRGRRLREILCSGTVTDIQKLRDMLAFDTLCPDARDFMASIEKGWMNYSGEIRKLNLNGNILKLYEILKNWNFRADVDQTGMTAMFHFRRTSVLPWLEADYNPTSGEMSTFLEELEETAETMLDLYGSLEVPWGDVHVIERGGSLVPVPGGTKYIPALVQAYLEMDSFDVEWDRNRDHLYGDSPGETDKRLKGKIPCNAGSSFIHGHVMDPKKPVSMMISPIGQTDAYIFPDSPHLLQQTLLFSKKEWINIPWTRDEVLKNPCPWGDDPDHEHPAVTTLTVSFSTPTQGK